MEEIKLHNLSDQNSEENSDQNSGQEFDVPETVEEVEQEIHDLEDEIVEEETGGAKQKVISLLLIVVSVLGFFFYIQPTRADLVEAETKLQELKLKEDTLKNKLVGLQNASDTLDLNSEVKSQQLINAIPGKLDQDKLLMNLVEIATKNDISFQSLSFGLSGDSETEVKKVTVNASFEGNYADLIHFLRAIEQNGRKMVVDNVSVQLLGEAINGIERVHFSLSIISFYRNGI